MKKVLLSIWLFVPVVMWGQVRYYPDPNNKEAKSMVYTPDSDSKMAALMLQPGIITELSVQEIGPIKHMNINVVTLKDVTHKTEWKALQLDYKEIVKTLPYEGHCTIDMDEWDGLITAIHMIDTMTRAPRDRHTIIRYGTKTGFVLVAIYNNLNWAICIIIDLFPNFITMDDLLQFVKIVEGEKAKINN